MRRFLGARFFIFGALLAAFIGACFFRGFAVDDALISVRYARNVANGVGWRFGTSGSATDGVTPLPWPLVIALLVKLKLSDGSAWSTFVAARALGWAAHAATVVILVRAIAAAKPSKTVWTIVLLSLLLSLPTSAYSASAMETPIVVLIATAGALLPLRANLAAILVGAAAAFRPELTPWAIVVAFGYGRTARARSLAVAIAVAPAAACVLIRAIAFGSPAPLAVMAKPSDLTHGAVYAATSIAIAVAPLLLCAPRALLGRTSSVPAAARVLAAAFVVHALVVVLVGGDWMPFARLFTPVLPATLYAFVLMTPHASNICTNIRAAIAIALAAGGAYAGRGYLHLLPERVALAAAARPFLANAHRVAALDIGWPTLSTDADFVDLAGLTDPAIAALPGGHTSKRVDPMFLLNRAPDVVLLYTRDGDASHLAEWTSFHYPRVVEARLVSDGRFTKRVEPIGYVPIGSSGYMVLRVFP